MNRRAYKCPKCKSPADSFIEVWHGHAIQFDSTSDGCLRCDTLSGEPLEGVLEPGWPHHVEAKCFRCGYQWRLRGVRQIWDIRPDATETDRQLAGE